MRQHRASMYLDALHESNRIREQRKARIRFFLSLPILLAAMTWAALTIRMLFRNY